jgi:hypothetical protein
VCAVYILKMFQEFSYLLAALRNRNRFPDEVRKRVASENASSYSFQ